MSHVAQPEPLGASAEGPPRPQVPWALLAPAGVLYLAFFIVPLGTLAVQSLWHAVPGGAAVPGFTLENYGFVLTDDYHLGILLRSLTLGVAVSAATLVLGYPVAYGISRAPRRIQPLLLAGVVFPLLTSAVVRSFGWMVLLTQDGPATALLAPLGAQSGSSGLMYTFGGLLIAMVHIFLPYMIFVLFGVIDQIDRDLERAASTLGASRREVVLHVLFPLSLPGVVAGTILVFTLSLSAFITPQLIGGPRLKVLASAIYDQTITLLNWPMAGAMAVVLIVIVLAGTIAYVQFGESRTRGIA